MKKIATITFHNALNVGAVLQAFALQKTLIDMGYESRIIDYRNREIENHYGLLNTTGKFPFNIAKLAVAAPLRVAKRRRFSKFSKRYLSLTEQISSDEDFERLNASFDFFIAGSDQIWNPYHTKKIDPRFFLDFVTNKSRKGTYAVSFGMTKIPTSLTGQYQELISGLDRVLVREPSGAEIIKRLSSGIEAVTVLDPVYLLAKDSWESLPSVKPKFKRPYILIFCVNGTTNDVVARARKEADGKGLDIIHLTGRPVPLKGIKTKTNIGPLELLGYIQSAEHVITDSFHAMSFSILFNIDFTMKIASQHGNKNNRSIELMDILDISNRTMEDELGFIDWARVNMKLKAERERSQKHLASILQDWP